MANVLDQIPGLGGYLAMQQHQRQSALGDLQGVMGLLNTVEQTKQRELQQQMLRMQIQKAQTEQEFRQQILGGLSGLTAPGAAGTAPGGQSRLNPVALNLALSGIPGGATAGRMIADATNPGDVEWKDTGSQLVPVYKGTGLPVPNLKPQPKEMSPDARATLDERRRQHDTPSAADAARIARDDVRLNYETGGGLPSAPAATPAAPNTQTTDWRDIEARRMRLLGQYVPPSEGGSGQAPGGLPPKVRNEITAANTKQMFELNSKQYDEFRKQVPAINATVRSLDRLQTLIDRGDTFANSGAEFKMTLSSIGQALGVPINVRKLADSEEYQAQVAELLKARLGSKDYGSGTGVSNLDLISAEQPLPSLFKSKEGQKQIIQALLADAKDKQEDIQAYRLHFERNSGNMNGFAFPSEAKTAERMARLQEIDKARTGASGGWSIRRKP